jgi:hypothetical protein
VTNAVALENISNWFAGFAEYAPSDLYRALAKDVLGAPDVMELLLVADEPQQLPMLLFAAVHHEVLARGGEYPQTSEDFIAFCREHAATLKSVMRGRATQTNEVGRCAYLWPALSAASDGRPLALVEVGASAGLNLNLDRYFYDFGEGRTAGEPESRVRLAPEVREGDPPIDLPAIASRIGIDLAPAPDPDWLRACVFADQPERLARLDAALAIGREHPPNLIQGDAVDLLPEVLAEIPDDVQPVVFHTAVWFYLSEDQQQKLTELTSSVTHVTAEIGTPEGAFVLAIDGRDVGSAHPHGRWINWTG